MVKIMTTNTNTNTDGEVINNLNGLMVQVKIMEEYPNYIIHSDGRVFNRITETWLNERTTKDRYKTVTMRDLNNNRVTVALHRLLY